MKILSNNFVILDEIAQYMPQTHFLTVSEKHFRFIPGFKSYLCHSVALWFEATYLISLSFGILVCGNDCTVEMLSILMDGYSTGTMP